MEIVEKNYINSCENERYFLPHHRVIKPFSTTTKVTAGFNSSCKTSNVISLNSILDIGHKLHWDHFEILLNIRLLENVFSADEEKMIWTCQILVSNKDQNYQLIVWRSNANEWIQNFKFKTITYGLAPSSFSATRYVKQAAHERTRNPIASRILLKDFYMDDLSTVREAIETWKEITHVVST